MRSIITVLFVSMVLVASSAYAGVYSQSLPIREITFGSTGNLYIYPAQESTVRKTVDHGGGPTTDLTVVPHFIPNPASCSRTDRITLKSDHPLYEILVNRMQAGISAPWNFLFPRFYISSSECTVGSPTMLRMKEVVNGVIDQACNLELMYQYNTDTDATTNYSCTITAIKY